MKFVFITSAVLALSASMASAKCIPQRDAWLAENLTSKTSAAEIAKQWRGGGAEKSDTFHAYQAVLTGVAPKKRAKKLQAALECINKAGKTSFKLPK